MDDCAPLICCRADGGLTSTVNDAASPRVQVTAFTGTVAASDVAKNATSQQTLLMGSVHAVSAHAHRTPAQTPGSRPDGPATSRAALPRLAPLVADVAVAMGRPRARVHARDRHRDELT